MTILRDLVKAVRDVFTGLAGLPYWPPRAVLRGLRHRRLASGGTVRTRNTVTPTHPHQRGPVVMLSPGRSTKKRPGETHVEAMRRLTEGEDL